MNAMVFMNICLVNNYLALHSSNLRAFAINNKFLNGYQRFYLNLKNQSSALSKKFSGFVS